MSRRVTVTLPDDVDERLPYEDHESQSECIVSAVRDGLKVDELEDELEATEARLDDLRRQLRESNARRDDVDEIVEYVESEKQLQEQRQERQNAPLWTRAKWWVLGRDP